MDLQLLDFGSGIWPMFQKLSLLRNKEIRHGNLDSGVRFCSFGRERTRNMNRSALECHFGPVRVAADVRLVDSNGLIGTSANLESRVLHDRGASGRDEGH